MLLVVGMDCAMSIRTCRDKKPISGRGDVFVMTYVVQSGRMQGVFLDLHVKLDFSWQVFF